MAVLAAATWVHTAPGPQCGRQEAKLRSSSTSPSFMRKCFGGPLTTRSKDATRGLLAIPGLTTRNKDATSNIPMEALECSRLAPPRKDVS